MNQVRRAEVQGSEEIINRLRNGKEKLERGEVAGAIEAFARVLESDPGNRVAKTLLALGYTKEGNLREAEKLYVELLSQTPEDATLCVSLGVLYLQMDRLSEATEFLQDALKLQPESKKAHSTLALVYVKQGRWKEARDEFKEAEQPAMVARMEEKIQEEETQKEREKAEEATAILGDLGDLGGDSDLPTGDTGIPGMEEEPLAVVVLPSSHEEKGAKKSEGLEDVPFLMGEKQKHPSNPPEAAGKKAKVQGPQWKPLQKTEGSDPKAWRPNLGSEEMWLEDGGDPGAFWLRSDNILQIRSKKQMYCRLRHLISTTGTLKLQWEQKRFQGKPIEQTFGPRDNPMARVEGSGLLYFAPESSKTLTVVQLSKSLISYFREGSVLAFEPEISWENGRVPSSFKGIPDLPLDNLWGDGSLLLASSGPLRGLQVQPGGRVRVAYRHLIGWVGALVPRIVVEQSLSLQDSEGPAFVEFEGEGGILISA